tara:strand:+ start:6329 stop:8296 length:1968 start_codon:yes stop_codon:yes gene_type:complete
MFKLKYFAVLIFLLINAIIYFIPNTLIQNNIEKDVSLNSSFSYSPLITTAVVPNEELHYAGQIAKINKGEYFDKRFVLFEQKDQFSPKFFPIPIFIGFLGLKIFGSIENFIIYKDLVFSFLILVASFFLLKQFNIRTYFALFGSILITSNTTFFTLFNLAIFNLEPESIRNPLTYVSYIAERFPHQIATIYFLLFNLLIFKLIKKNNIKNSIFLGLFSGLSFYTYFYSVITVSLQIGFIFVVLSILRKKINFYLILSGFIFIIIGSPYIYNTFIFLLTEEPFFIDLAHSKDYFSLADIGKSNIELTTIIIVSSILLYFFSSLNKKYLNISLVLLSIGIPMYLVAIFSTYIQFIPEASHLFAFIEWPSFQLLTLIVLINFIYDFRKIIFLNKFLIKSSYLNLVNNLISKLRILINFLVLSYLLMWTYVFVSFQIKLSNDNYANYIISNEERDAYKWLNENAEKDSVFLTIDTKEMRTIRAHTGLFSYITDYTEVIVLEDNIKRLKESFQFFDLPLSEVKNLLLENKFDENKYSFKSSYGKKNFKNSYNNYNINLFAETFNLNRKKQRNFFEKYINENENEIILSNHRYVPLNFLTENFELNYRGDLGNVKLLENKVDYIWFGPFEKNLSKKVEILSDNLVKKYENIDITIYQVNKN